jgi:hypothetical protein
MTCVGLYLSNSAFVEAASLGRPIHSFSDPTNQDEQTISIPKISVARSCKDPFLSRLLSKFRAFRLCLNHILDRLTDQAATPGDENYLRHVLMIREWLNKVKKL